MTADSSPDWFDEAKLGIFIHWTAAAIPAFAPTRPIDLGDPELEWEAMIRDQPYAEQYVNTMLVPGSATARFHEEHYPGVPFDRFVEEFRDGLSAWDPEPWAELFERAGAKYVVLVTKHFDGFALWPTDAENPNRANWHAERDVVGELARAVRARGLKFGVYYCGGLDYSFGGFPFFTKQEMIDATPQSEDYARYADAQWRELIDRYEPSILWNDMDYPATGDASSIVEHYRDVVPDGVVNDRFELWEPRELPRDFVTLEYRTDYSTAPADQAWESCRGVGASFGFNREESDSDYTPADELLEEFLEIVAHGGNLLLNVGPTASGDVPWSQAQRLLQIGWWLRRNGEAVYGTKRWSTPRVTMPDGRAVRFTHRPGAVYALLSGVSTADVELPLEVPPGSEVTLLGSNAELTWSVGGGSTRIQLSDPPAQPVIALRLASPSFK